MSRPAALAVSGLGVSLQGRQGEVPIVTDMSFEVHAGEAVALVGESGCGKSITARAIIGLLPPRMTLSGSIRLDGEELIGLAPKARRAIGGARIGFIFQEPMSSLHPTLTIGAQMTDALRAHQGLSRRAALDRAAELLDRVGIPRSRGVLGGYVHQLSGGMRQRVMIAMAVSCGPGFVIADEPTTALDVTIQAQVLELLAAMRQELGLAMLYITHDLEVVRDFCDRAIVMYAGDLVEQGTPGQCLNAPLHPYTRGLVDAIPQPGDTRRRLAPIAGQVPAVGTWPAGCCFAGRCSRDDARCEQRPALAGIGADRAARCWHPLEQAA